MKTNAGKRKKKSKKSEKKEKEKTTREGINNIQDEKLVNDIENLNLDA